jgi:hypothetical protein
VNTIDYARLISVHEIELAVDKSCSCGGMGPNDEGVCGACLVWHRLVTDKLPQAPRLGEDTTTGA